MDSVNLVQLVHPTKPLNLSLQELETVMKTISTKKCFGPDGIPQNLIKDVFGSVPETLLTIINEISKRGLPDQLKGARVIPLHKKGSKNEVTNY